jgi:hypothetical protein
MGRNGPSSSLSDRVDTETVIERLLRLRKRYCFKAFLLSGQATKKQFPQATKSFLPQQILGIWHCFRLKKERFRLKDSPDHIRASKTYVWQFECPEGVPITSGFVTRFTDIAAQAMLCLNFRLKGVAAALKLLELANKHAKDEVTQRVKFRVGKGRMKEYDRTILDVCLVIVDLLQSQSNVSTDHAQVIALTAPAMPKVGEGEVARPRDNRGSRRQQSGELKQIITQFRSICRDHPSKPLLAICKLLDYAGVKRPPQASWKELSWEEALRSPRHQSSVRKWASKHRQR